MAISARLSRVWNSYGTQLLKIVFAAVLLGRFLLPFFFNPLDRIYSDMQRHVNNGVHLLNPNFLGSADPKAYQVWIYFLDAIDQSNKPLYCAIFTGLLCAGMPWFWYKALREITTRNKALMLAIVLGVHLSFVLIYAFFMTETLLLTAVALAVWLMLRAIRKRTLASFMAAACAWLLAAFTKQTALPIVLLGLGYALHFQPNKVRAVMAASALFIAALIPASWHSFQALHFVAPFGYSGKEKIIRESRHTLCWFYVEGSPYNGGYWWWLSPSFVYNPLQPFGTYTPKRSDAHFLSVIELWQGKAGWDRALRRVEIGRTWNNVLEEYQENFVFLFFSGSWPDAKPDDTATPYSDSPPDTQSAEYSLQQWNFHLRWLWVPCFALLLFYGPLAQLPAPKTWILLVAFAMTWLFLLQDVAVVEGRYRKLMEPFLILSVFFMLESLLARAQPGHRINLWHFTLQIYLYPLLRQLLGAVFPPGHPEGKHV